LHQFIAEVFQSPSPERDGRTITAAEMLAASAKKLETDLTNQPARRATLQAALGDTYDALGLYQDAVPLREKARDYHLATSGLEHTNTIQALNKLANTYLEAHRANDALRIAEEARAVSRKVLGLEHRFTIQSMQGLAGCYIKLGRKDDALKLNRETLDLSLKVNGPQDRDTLRAMESLAESYFDAGCNDATDRLLDEVLTIRIKTLGSEHPSTLATMSNLAYFYSQTDRPDEAIKLGEEVLRLQRKVLGPEHPGTLLTFDTLVENYARANRSDEAVKMREGRVALTLKNDPDSTTTAAAYAKLGFTLDAVGRGDDAIKAWQEAVRIDPAGTKNTHYWLGKALTDRQRYAEALPILRATQKLYPDGERGRETAVRVAEAEAALGKTPSEPQTPNVAFGDPAMERLLATLRSTVAANPLDTDKAKLRSPKCRHPCWLPPTARHGVRASWASC
jgi:tetratricopeptide (TPR) repeat protein